MGIGFFEYMRINRLADNKGFHLEYDNDGGHYIATLPEKRFDYIYFLKHGDAVKIGRTNNLDRRVKQISPVMPHDLEIVHVVRTNDPANIEKLYHKKYADARLNGEWFDVSKIDMFDLKITRRVIRIG